QRAEGFGESVAESQRFLAAAGKVIGQHQIDLAEFVEVGGGGDQLIGKVENRVGIFFEPFVRRIFRRKQGNYQPATGHGKNDNSKFCLHNAFQNGLPEQTGQVSRNAALFFGRWDRRVGGGCRRRCRRRCRL